MKMLDQNAFQEIDSWMKQNARPLEMALWNYHFKGETKEAVVNVLSCYQNPDGGFGNALEPDLWNPESSPYETLVAVGILEKIGLAKTAGTSHPIIKGILRFLAGGQHSDAMGWHFSVPSNDRYARAPWWTYSEETNRVQDMGITAGLCSFIFGTAGRDTQVYRKADAYTRSLLAAAMTAADFGEMGAGAIYGLLGVLFWTGRLAEFPCDGLKERLEAVLNRRIERNPENWKNYTPRPSEFILTPESPLYRGNETVVDQELDYLVGTRNPRGVWNITWSWYGMGEKYAKEFAISENWWMAVKAIEKTEFLRSFGRIEGIGKL